MKALLADAHGLRDGALAVLDAAQTAHDDARRRYEEVVAALVREQLATIPVGRLKETTQDRLHVRPLEDAGLRTVSDVLARRPYELQWLRGVGAQTAQRAVAAARQLEHTLTAKTRVRFDPDRRPRAQLELLRALARWDVIRSVAAPDRDRLEQLPRELEELIEAAAPARSRVKLAFSGGERRAHVQESVARLHEIVRLGALGDDVSRLVQVVEETEEVSATDAGSMWAEYAARAPHYNGLLIEIGGLAPDAEVTQGFVPRELADRVNAQELDTGLLDVSLRGYQAFGAKFALVQQRAIIGDEMGLGKTVQALAAIAHLRSDGETHFLVVCPASVLVNWLHEILRHTRLPAHRIHGSDRSGNALRWARRDGIAVTTYDALKTLAVPDHIRVGMLVVDEAHYVKNPDAQRTQAVRRQVALAKRTLYLTGTPMENRVEEFQSLVGQLQPELAAKIRPVDSVADPASFRRVVAPSYLRRNQVDVLDELPPRIEAEEWVVMTRDDLDAYRAAVISGNFMAMRRAAYDVPTTTGSAKLSRLAEIVDEAMANNRKVVVFSFFKDVLERVGAALGDLVVGTITGGVPPPRRQELLDRFSARPAPSVLVSQIEAGGVGLNMQAASVVILTEPQWKPTIEDQAIARLHRMGQIRPVDVHRLLAEDSVDQRMLEVLGGKAALFDEYVRRSESKEISPDAVDVSDLETTREVATQAETERRIIEIERKRLRLEDTVHLSAGHDQHR